MRGTALFWTRTVLVVLWARWGLGRCACVGDGGSDGIWVRKDVCVSAHEDAGKEAGLRATQREAYNGHEGVINMG